MQTKTNALKRRIRYYFNFDEVVYYSYPEFVDDENRSLASFGPEKLTNSVLLNDYHPDMLLFLEQTDSTKFGFKKRFVSKQKTEKIRAIFSLGKRSIGSFSTNGCGGPVYRDILVFKKDKKLQAYAKICFSCNESFIFGSLIDNISKLDNQDMRELLKLLHE